MPTQRATGNGIRGSGVEAHHGAVEAVERVARERHDQLAPLQPIYIPIYLSIDLSTYMKNHIFTYICIHIYI